MRQIESISAVLAALIFNRKPESAEIIAFREAFALGDLLTMRLGELLAEGKINEAENLLFEALDESPGPEYLKSALDFYGSLAAMPDGELEKLGFSREEIYEGLKELENMFLPGIDGSR